MSKQIEYEFHKPITGICKSHGIWKVDGCTLSPMVYLRKPKHISEGDFQNFINRLSFLVKGE